MIDFEKLLDPYKAEKDGAERTIEMQVKWLLSKGVPRSHVDQALLTVYSEVAAGRTFEETEAHSAGHHLDHELLRVAQALHKAELEESVKRLQESFNAVAARHAEFTTADLMAKMNKKLNFLQRFGKWLFRL